MGLVGAPGDSKGIGMRQVDVKECLPLYSRLIAEEKVHVSNGGDASCLAPLLGRDVSPGEDVELGELFPRPSQHRVFRTSLELLWGNWPTPLLRVGDAPREAWAKLEWYNPFSQSIKDRTVYGLLSSIAGDRLVEVSSGNTAIAMAALGAVFGKRVRIFLPRVSRHVAKLLELLGAEVVLSDAENTVEALDLMRKEVEQGAVHPNQFQNDANFLVHLRTAAEIDWQLRSIGERPTHVVGTIGTSGHLAAIGFYMSARYGARTIAVQPADWIPGIRRVETGMKWIHWVEHELVSVSLAEALTGVRDLARRTGLLAGPSSGAAYYEYARRREEGTYVLIFPDDLYKYTHFLALNII